MFLPINHSAYWHVTKFRGRTVTVLFSPGWDDTHRNEEGIMDSRAEMKL